ncbi:MAG TPA: hypothetical protein VG868_02665 [Casimicrobiaceae bacterium]|jgi:hypothetical protein|nr:hypothetical protein [Casimicrobiaceae bacterium]
MLRRRYALRRYTALVFLLVAPLGAEACRHKSLAPAPEPPPKTILHVANGEFLDAVVYVVDRGQRVRLGVASSNRTTNFEIPAHILFAATPLSFVADPIGAPARPSTGDVVIVPGDDLELRLSGGRAILTKRP